MRISPRGTLAAVASLAFILTLGACADTGAGTTPQGKDKVVYVGAAANPGIAQVILYAVPLVMGYFDEENLEVEYQPADGGTAALQAVAAGSGDITHPDAGNIPQAVSRGVPIKAFGSVVEIWPYQFAVLDNSPVRSVADLKGKSVGVVSLSSGSKPYADAVLKDAGLISEKDTKIIPVGSTPASRTTALTDGKVDALALFHEAYVQMEQQGIKLRYLPNPDFFTKMVAATWVAKSSALTGESPPAVRFARAAYKGLLAAAANPEMAVKAGYKVFPTRLPKSGNPDDGLKEAVEILQAASTSLASLGNPDNWAKDYEFGMIDAEQWEAIQEYSIAAGTADGKSAVDSFFIDTYIKFLNDFDREAVIKQARAKTTV